MFKSVRQLYATPEQAHGYLRSLTEAVPVYASLSNPYDEWWQQEDGKYREAVHFLDGLKLFGIRQPYTILMAAFLRNFSPDEFIKTLKYLYVLSIRYNVICSFSPSEQEKTL